MGYYLGSLCLEPLEARGEMKVVNLILTFLHSREEKLADSNTNIRQVCTDS